MSPPYPLAPYFFPYRASSPKFCALLIPVFLTSFDFGGPRVPRLRLWRTVPAWIASGYNNHVGCPPNLRPLPAILNLALISQAIRNFIYISTMCRSGFVFSLHFVLAGLLHTPTRSFEYCEYHFLEDYEHDSGSSVHF